MRNGTGIDRPLSSQLKRGYVRFVKIRGHSREIALGIALGVFIGFSPTMGIQTILAVFLAALFGWSKISSAVGVWVTNPFTAPFLYWVTYQVGATIIGSKSTVNPEAFLGFVSFTELIHDGPRIFLALLVGGLIVGLPMAALSFVVSRAAVDGYRVRKKRTLRRKQGSSGA